MFINYYRKQNFKNISMNRLKIYLNTFKIFFYKKNIKTPYFFYGNLSRENPSTIQPKT